jgi:hypothetical protein
MTKRLRWLGVLVLIAGLTACEDLTPPLRDPVTHDLTITTLSFTDDYNASGVKEKRPMNSTATGLLLVDFQTKGARMDPAGPCGLANGRWSVGSGVVSARFESEDEGGPLLTLSGLQDSVGVMTGSFTCRTRTLGPHFYTYEGSFTATPRK